MIEIIDIDESYTHIKVNGDLDYARIIIDTLSVYEEGYQFSPMFRQKLWDGKKHFYEILDNQVFQIPKGLTAYIIKDLKSRKKEFTHSKIQYNDAIVTKEGFRDFVKSLNTPFMPYDFQEQAALDSINEKRLVLQSSTSSGKSFILFMLTKWFLKENKRVLIVVPSIGLVSQMASDFEDYGWAEVMDSMKQIGGELTTNKDLSEKPVVLSTWQSLQYMKQKEFEIFDAILVDEAHKIQGDALDGITKNAINCSWKVGMTGTIPRVRTSKLQLLGTLGPVKKVINAKGLIDRGLATDVDINCIFLKHSTSAIENFYRNCGQKPKYPDEEKYLSTDTLRNSKVAKILMKISESGNTIGLFSKTAHGELILKNVIKERTGNTNIQLLHKFTPKPIKEAYTKFQSDKSILFYVNKKIELKDKKKIRTNVLKVAIDEKDADEFIENIKSLDDENIGFYNGAVDAETREFLRQKMEKIDSSHEKSMIIIGNYSVLSTGISIKQLQNVVLLSSLKAFTTIVQVIGRLLRLHKNKSKAHLFDLIDDVSKVNPRSVKENYVLRHFYQRLEYYREEGYNIKEKEILL